MSETHKLTIYRITLKCRNVPVEEGARMANAIDKEFNAKTWHADAYSWWDGERLFLTAWNDFDDTGLALRQEFMESIRAHVQTALVPEIETVEVLTST